MMNQKKIKTAAIVAMSDNRVIGNKNALPWHLPEDLKHFKAVTMGKPIVMGRLTFDSIGKPLPGRANIVVTRQSHWSCENVLVAHDLPNAISLAQSEAAQNGIGEIMIVGGSKIYQQALPLLDMLYVTEVHADIEGDAMFPVIDPVAWEQSEREGPYKSEKSGLAFSFVIYKKQLTS